MFNKYASQLRPHQALLMHLDPCLLPVSLHGDAQSAFSGIYFKPTFHYELLPGYEGSPADRLQKRHEKRPPGRARLRRHFRVGQPDAS